MSPLLVTICASSRNRQQERYLRNGEFSDGFKLIFFSSHYYYFFFFIVGFVYNWRHGPRVSRQLPGHPHVPLPRLQAVDTADVVQAAGGEHGERGERG